MNLLVRWVREHRREVIIGIVCTLITTFLLSVCINPILDLLLRGFYWIGTTFLVSRLDAVAREAAKGDPPVVIPVLAFSYIAMLCFVVLVLTVLRTMFEAIGFVEGQVTKWKLRPATATDGAEAPTTNASTELKPFPLRCARRLWWALVVISVAWAGYSFLHFGSMLMTVTIRQQFHHQLALVAPHIDEDQEERLVADFASMKGIMDYEAVMKRIDEIAAEHEVELP